MQSHNNLSNDVTIRNAFLLISPFLDTLVLLKKWQAEHDNLIRQVPYKKDMTALTVYHAKMYELVQQLLTRLVSFTLTAGK